MEQGPWIEGGPPIRKSLNCAGGFAFPEKSAGTSQAAGAVEGAAADGAIGPEDVPAVYSTPSTVQTADSGDLLLNIQDLAFELNDLVSLPRAPFSNRLLTKAYARAVASRSPSNRRPSRTI